MAIRRRMLFSTERGGIKRIPWDYIMLDGQAGCYVSPMPVPENLGQTYAAGTRLKIDLLFEPDAQKDYEVDDIQYFKSENHFTSLHDNVIGQYVTDAGQSNEFGYPCDRYGAKV